RLPMCPSLCPITRPLPSSTLFPYTTLFRSFVPQKSDLDAGLSVESDETLAELEGLVENADYSEIGIEDDVAIQYTGLYYETDDSIQPIFMLDRKSTRLNSSHVSISYAVFCLKKRRVH